MAGKKSSFKRRRHGRSGTPTYKAWSGMLQRCTNPKNTQYKWYGERGITVCEKWRRFEAFSADMGECPPSYSLDRIDVEGHYEPGNCRWASKQTQANNTRSNRILIVDGERVTLAEAARRWGIPMGTIWMRLKRGWSDSDAAKRPLRA